MSKYLRMSEKISNFVADLELFGEIRYGRIYKINLH